MWKGVRRGCLGQSNPEVGYCFWHSWQGSGGQRLPASRVGAWGKARGEGQGQSKRELGEVGARAGKFVKGVNGSGGNSSGSSSQGTEQLQAWGATGQEGGMGCRGRGGSGRG